jgi:hypothetical protein
VGACWPDIKTICPRVQIIITTYGELDKNNYLDPRTAQVATVDHIKQVMLQTLHLLILDLVLKPAMHI